MISVNMYIFIESAKQNKLDLNINIFHYFHFEMNIFGRQLMDEGVSGLIRQDCQRTLT